MTGIVHFLFVKLFWSTPKFNCSKIHYEFNFKRCSCPIFFSFYVSSFDSRWCHCKFLLT